MTALQLIVSEAYVTQLGRAGSDVPPPRLSGSSEPASSQVAEPDPTADHKHQSRPAPPWAAAARGAGGTCPLVRGGVVMGCTAPSMRPGRVVAAAVLPWPAPSRPAFLKVGREQCLGWRPDPAAMLPGERSEQMASITNGRVRRLIFTAILTACIGAGATGVALAVTSGASRAASTSTATTSSSPSASPSASPSHHCTHPGGNQGLWREFADHPGAAVGAGSTRALGRPGNGATPPHARHLPAHRPPVGLPAQGRF